MKWIKFTVDRIDILPFFGVLGLIVFLLFWGCTQGITVVDHTFQFGFHAPEFALIIPFLVGAFIWLTLFQYLVYKKLSKPSFQTFTGALLIVLAFVINGVVSESPEKNLWMIFFLIGAFLPLCWTKIPLSQTTLYWLFLVGLIVNYLLIREDISLPVLSGVFIILWYVHFQTLESAKNFPNQVLAAFLSIVGLKFLEQGSLVGIILLFALIQFWYQRKFLWRKTKTLWLVVFVAFLLGFLFWGWQSFGALNFDFTQTQTLWGVGFSEGIEYLVDTSATTVLPTDFLLTGIEIFWTEWGVFGSVLLLGLLQLWRSINLKNTWMHGLCFVAFLILLPGITNILNFWLILAFFTWNRALIKS